MRIVVMSDSHLGIGLPTSGSSDPRRWRRHRDFADAFERACRHALATGADALLHAGDVFDRSKPPSQVVASTYAWFHRLADEGVEVVIAPGNHERGRMPLPLLLSHPRVHVLGEPRTVIVDRPSGRLAIAGCRFQRVVDGDRFATLVARSRIGSAQADMRLFVTHLAFEGATVGSPPFTFRRRADTVPESSWPRPEDVDLVLSGHVHRHQVLRAASRTPVVYAGSLERTSFRERNEQPGFLEIEASTRSRVVRHRATPARPMHRLAPRAEVIDTLRVAAQETPARALLQLDLSEVDDDERTRLPVDRLWRCLRPEQLLQVRWQRRGSLHPAHDAQAQHRDVGMVGSDGDGAVGRTRL